MKNKLRVLIVEDLPSDTELAERELRTVIKNFTVQVVDTKEDFEKALETFKPDLIISDYQMPVFDGLSALKIKQKKSPFTPFVLLTGSTNEDTAVECIKAGADDYVIKEHIKRLGPAALKAIEKKRDELKRKQIEEALQRSEELNRSITESAADAIISINSDGIILSWNNAAGKIFGYSSSEMINKNLSEIIPPRYKDGHNSGIKRLKIGGKIIIIGQTIELTAFRKNGDEFPIELSLSSWETNNQKYFTGIIRDITERKKAEEELIKLSTAVQQSPSVITITDLNGNLEYVNPKFTYLTGYTSEEAIGKNPRILKSGVQTDEFYKELWNTISSGKEWHGEFHNKKKNGELFWEAASISPIFNKQGKKVNYLKVSEDITERKQAEEALQESEKQLQTLINAMPDFVCFKDGDGHWLKVNDAGIRIFQLESIDYRGKKDSELAKLNSKFQDSFLTCEESDARAWKEGNLIQGEETFPDPDGSVRVFDVAKVPVINPDGERKGLVVLGHDITERKKAEEKNARFSRIFEDSLNEIYLFNADTLTYIQVNNAAQHNLGYTMEELKKLTPLDINPELTSESFAKLIAPLRKGEKGKIVFETVHKRKNQSLYNVEVHMQLLIYDQKLIFTAIILDITERKQAEEALLRSEERMRTMFEEAPLGIALIDSLTGHIYEVNQRFAQIAGRSKKEMAPIDWMSITHPDDVQEDMDNMALLNAGKITGFNMNKRYILPDGSIVWINMTIAPIKVKDKTHPRHLCMIEDITERKQMEVTLQESEKRFKNLFNDLGDAIFVTKIGGANKGRILEANPAATKQSGYTRNELLKMNIIRDISIPGSEKMNTDEWEEKLQNGETVTTCEMKRKKDGTEFWTEVIVTPIEFKGEKASLSINHDITERKQAEEEIKKKIIELEIFNDASVDREIMINELRKEVNEMLKKMGEKAKYKIIT